MSNETQEHKSPAGRPHASLPVSKSRRYVVALVIAGVWLLTVGRPAQAQPPPPQPPPAAQNAAAQVDDEQNVGIPVTSELVKSSCVRCHKIDDKNRMTRVSFRRTTPEGWQETLRRMVALNDLVLEPAEAREILAYLANHHGLAPEEARPAAFEVEKRMIDFKYADDKDTEQTCTKCHSMGRVISQRRTKEEWELLVAMHRGYYPLSDFQAFRRMAPIQREPGPDGRPPDNRHPMEKAIEHLTKAFPLVTPEWSAWSATMRPPRLEGRWALSGYQPGRGAVYGEVVIKSGGKSEGAGPTTSASEFTTTARYVYARSGKTVTRDGRALVYAGFQWRGRSSESSPATTAPSSRSGGAIQSVPQTSNGGEPSSPASVVDQGAMREVMFVDRDWRTASGRWFTGAYDEIGIDITLHRIGTDPFVLGAERMLKSSLLGQEVLIYGANLPASASPADFNFGPGVAVTRIVRAGPDRITLQVDVAGEAVDGIRDVFLSGASGRASIGVYNKIDGIKVLPQAGLARVGGANFPKQHQQFEAVAYVNGADGKPGTKDDVLLGIVEAQWSVEEYAATFDDDDREFVGTIDPATGLFTPNVDGPNPKRRNGANNYGDVWAVATYLPPGAPRGTKPLRARAHLLITVPLYMKWDTPEVAR